MRIGPYETQSEIGRGGMGVVYRARSPLGEEVAVKVLLKLDAEKLARFERERRLIGTFTARDGFVPLIDAGTAAQGPYLVMPFVEGGTLRQRLREGPLGVAETIALGDALAAAVGRAHERGIVHRDLKPENVLFTVEGQPLIADLGLAKHFDRSAPGASQSVGVSARGALRGTAGYMAPEQMADASSAGPEADVFALGAILYECLAGRPAFEGESFLEVIAKVADGRVVALRSLRSDVPAWLAQAIERALDRDPAGRFADAFALRRSLLGAWPNVPLRLSRLPAAGLGAALLLCVTGLLAARGAPFWATPPIVSRPPVSRSEEAAELCRWGDLVAQQVRGWDDAIVLYGRAIERDPKLAAACSGRGAAKLAKGDVDGAIADCTKAIGLDPRLKEAWLTRGGAYNRVGSWDAALVDFTRALELDPNLATAWGDRSGARCYAGDVDGALADITKAIELDPGRTCAWFRYSRGVVKERKGDDEGAIADYTEAIEIDPSFARAWGNRGALGARRARSAPDLDLAISDLTESHRLDPGDTLVLYNRANARDTRCDWDGAIMDLTEVIAREPSNANARALRASAKESRGDRAGMISDAERFLELFPEDPRAPALRRHLERVKAGR